MNTEIDFLRKKIRQIISEDYRFQYDNKTFFPNEKMKETCQKAIDIVSRIKLVGKGEAEGSGLRKAYSIKAGKPMSHGQLKRMKAFFDNNLNLYKNELSKGKTINNSGLIQKWNLWGGDAAYSWVKYNLESHKSKNQNSKDNRPKGHKNMMDPYNTRTKTALSYVKNNLREEEEKKNFNSIINKKVYHGTPDARFSQIKNSLLGQLSDELTTGKKGVVWFTDNYNTAKTYADPKRAFDYQNAEPKVFEKRISILNPLIVDAKGEVWRKAEFYFDDIKITGTRQLVDFAKENGYDGIMVKNVYDNYNHFKGEHLMKKYLANTFAIFNDNQIS